MLTVANGVRMLTVANTAKEELRNDKRPEQEEPNSAQSHVHKILKEARPSHQAQFKRRKFSLTDSLQLCYLLERPSREIQCIFWFLRGCMKHETENVKSNQRALKLSWRDQCKLNRSCSFLINIFRINK